MANKIGYTGVIDAQGNPIPQEQQIELLTPLVVADIRRQYAAAHPVVTLPVLTGTVTL